MREGKGRCLGLGWASPPNARLPAPNRCLRAGTIQEGTATAWDEEHATRRWEGGGGTQVEEVNPGVKETLAKGNKKHKEGGEGGRRPYPRPWTAPSDPGVGAQRGGKAGGGMGGLEVRVGVRAEFVVEPWPRSFDPVLSTLRRAINESDSPLDLVPFGPLRHWLGRAYAPQVGMLWESQVTRSPGEAG